MQRMMSKIVLLGDGAVGKTSIRRRYLGQGFSASHMMTIGADFASKRIMIGDNLEFNAQIWDLAGQVQFEAVRQRFYLGTSAAMMVFDVTNRATFMNIPTWLTEMFRVVTNKVVPILIIGNKIDLPRKVTQKEALNYIEVLRQAPFFKNIPIEYIETSAKDGTNIEEAFDRLIRLIFDITTKKQT